ncbi:hypothetical protein GCM10009681_35810 [Luedemannella helvata]|uniref:Uncharacterized protein n=1 Tax=Luedemannella helvata TaxID=349315 RepID=A0ABN2KP03_9ACTN
MMRMSKQSKARGEGLAVGWPSATLGYSGIDYFPLLGEGGAAGELVEQVVAVPDRAEGEGAAEGDDPVDGPAA